MAALVCAAGANAQRKAALYDSTQVEALNEIVVKGVRTQKNAPFAVANIKKKELNAFSNTGKELPFLFSQTPGVLAWSENGLGTGTTYMRIRGAGDSRINVTLDGVPLNSPEDQCVFWANMNSYGSLLGSVQIQRGVGTSTNGDGAFGGTVALASAIPNQKAGGEVSVSYGSFNTFNVGGKFSTGLLWNHLIFDGAYHETNTDGFIHGTSGRSGSYYGGLTWIGNKFQIRYKNIGNFEKTGQAWNGVTAGDNDMSLMDGTYGINSGIKTYKDMWNAGLGKYNSLYEYLTSYDKDANGNYPTARYQMNDGSYWDKTTDNFWQNHNILSAAYDINDNWSISGSLHYTHGYGYYNEFRYNYKLKKFGMTYDGVKKSDFVRKKGLSQNTYGFIWNANYKNDSWDVIGGMSLQEFDGNHFGYVTYIANDDVRKKYMSNGDYKYYDSDATKFDGSTFVKAAYHINEQWDIFGDLQYRYVQYETNGKNDKFYSENSGYYNQMLNIDESYHFLNPKAGFSWNLNNHRVYGSVALSHREPERNNFTDNFNYPYPKAESLFDYELGYTFNNDIFRFGINGYYMDYNNQFVQTGQETEIGEKVTTNIKDSYRMGIEIQAGVDPFSWLTIEGNAALSKNKIKDFDEVASVNWEDDFRTIHYDNSTLAFSPSTILNGFVNLHWNGLQAVWHTNFVSRQYLDNTENADRSLPCYSASDANISYTWKPNKAIKECIFGLNFNNIFNRRYAANGWVYSSIVEEYGHPNENRYYQIGFIPMAGFTMMGNVTLRF
ncbi:iron complex outermembrane recepter protein [Xylanibacter ruminicola]|uniref:Iron complex outermembrane recepter protein n=2 Tax=Xylanibacter ruminicola TaxID=839 RepID=A0A1H3YC77_XYLRU|nr:iron complex outermembrane recepter protein [Xylanibacter ruminicola]